jgi:hypothetical protein
VQQEAEVVAESLFIGVQCEIEMTDRFKDIESETNAIAYWLARDRSVWSNQRENDDSADEQNQHI